MPFLMAQVIVTSDGAFFDGLKDVDEDATMRGLNGGQAVPMKHIYLAFFSRRTISGG